jgi:plasmid maintenance system antidote protein VapI
MSRTRGGARLQKWLEDERRSQAWLAEQIGFHQTNISAWIRGRPISLAAAQSIEAVTSIATELWLEAEESGPALPSDAAPATKAG